MRDLLKFLVLPPVALYLAIGIGLVLAWRRQRVGLPLAAGALGLLMLLSMPLTAGVLMKGLQADVAPLDLESALSTGAEAIVVLSAGLDAGAPEASGGALADDLSLARLRYGAALARESQLPLLVTGGDWGRTGVAAGSVLADSLKRDFGIEASWIENRAGNTRENAIFSAALLNEKGITRIILVTHAWHMKRAELAFKQAGFDVVPAPMGFEGQQGFRLSMVLPSAKGLHTSYYALHELIGQAWYRLTG